MSSAQSQTAGVVVANGEVTTPVHSTSSTHSKRFMEGPLSKWTNVVNGWQYRWFVLDQSAGLLSYYTVSHRTMDYATHYRII